MILNIKAAFSVQGTVDLWSYIMPFDRYSHITFIAYVRIYMLTFCEPLKFDSWWTPIVWWPGGGVNPKQEYV